MASFTFFLKEMSLHKGTRQLTDNSDKTVHRHGFWKQFTNRIEDSSQTNVIFYL